LDYQQTENPRIILKSQKSPRNKLFGSGSIVRLSNQFDQTNILESFRRFLKIDMALSPLTVTNHVWKTKKFLSYVNKPVNMITKEDVRSFLEMVKENYAVNTYCCFLKGFRRFFRDYLGKPDLADFRFPSIPLRPKMLDFDKDDLVKFYEAIEHEVIQMMFLGYCVTGLRRNDIMSLTKTELNRDLKMILKNSGSRTKHRWITFYNEELAKHLEPYLDSRKDDNPRVFPVSKCKTFPKYWYNAQSKTGLKITPKDLRDWFCVEMTNLNVPDRYIDAFCGRVPKTILGRHYTDYSPKKLKGVYDKANLNLFS